MLTERQGRVSDDSVVPELLSAVPKPGRPRVPWPAVLVMVQPQQWRDTLNPKEPGSSISLFPSDLSSLSFTSEREAQVHPPTTPPQSWGLEHQHSVPSFHSCFPSSSRNQKGFLICISVWTLKPCGLRVTSVVRPLDIGPASNH